MTRHACVRLAQRANVRTTSDLINAARQLWLAPFKLMSERLPNDNWLDPPGDAWRLPLADGGPVAVLEPDMNGARRLVVKTVLEAAP